MNAPLQEKKHRIVKTLALVVIVCVLMIMAFLAGWLAQKAFQKADATARYSAQAALLVEIDQLLSAVPTGSAYPHSLEELPLTYPDGGDALLLELFCYESNGNTCALRTRLGDRWIMETFPRRAKP